MKTFVNRNLIEARVNEVMNTNLLSEEELIDLIEKVEEDLILEKANEIRAKRMKMKGPSFNGVF